VRRTCLSLAILFAAAAVVGCPAPTAPDQKAKAPAANAGPANAGPANAAPAAAKPGDAAAAPPPGPAAAPPDGAPPKGGPDIKELSFARLIGEGESIDIRVKVNGAETGQVDFIVLGGAGHEVELVHVEKFTKNEFLVKAPATYPQPIYVNALSLAEGEDPGPNAASGALAEPIKLAGEDLQLEITIGENVEVLKALMPVSDQPDKGPEPPPPVEPDENAPK